MELKDKITLLSILATFIVAFINLLYMILDNRKTAFVNTVTASRLKWIDSLRDKVSSFIAITVQILMQECIRQRFCTRWDEQPAAALGKSLLRLGICQPEDWTGSAVDFVERGYKRFCNQNGAGEAGNVWKGNLRIIDSLFEMTSLSTATQKRT